MTTVSPIDQTDRRLIAACQDGLPLCPEPYRALADQLELPHEEILERVERLLSVGVVRRIGAVPNHYALGYRANGMTVWDLDDHEVSRLGRRVGALAFVSHCYRRPRRLPDWPYNLFAMVHGRSRDQVDAKVEQIAALLGSAARGHDVLFSTRILKKTGLRLRRGER
ncbi:MAG: AsnC family transcriptional regulator [Pseudomonadota bacterium]